MTSTLYLSLAILVGVGAATQSALLAAIGRDKGPYEATWINMLAAIGGLSLLFVLRALSGRAPLLTAPFHLPITFAVVATLTGVALAISVRGLNPAFAITGLFAIAYLLGISYGAPKIGIALFVAGVTVGQLAGALAYDHVGAFGLAVHPPASCASPVLASCSAARSSSASPGNEFGRRTSDARTTMLSW